MSEWNHSVCEHCWHAKHGDRPACRIIEPEVDICCYCRRLHTFGAYIRAAPTTVLCDGQHLLETLRTERDALKAENGLIRNKWQADMTERDNLKDERDALREALKAAQGFIPIIEAHEEEYAPELNEAAKLKAQINAALGKGGTEQ